MVAQDMMEMFEHISKFILFDKRDLIVSKWKVCVYVFVVLAFNMGMFLLCFKTLLILLMRVPIKYSLVNIIAYVHTYIITFFKYNFCRFFKSISESSCIFCSNVAATVT